MLALGFIGTRLTLQKPITVHNGPHQQPTRPIKHDERTNRGSTTPQESRADPRRTLTKISNPSHEQTAPEREDSAPHSHADPVQRHLHEGRVTGGHNPTHPRSPPRTGHMDTPGDPQGHIKGTNTSSSSLQEQQPTSEDIIKRKNMKMKPRPDAADAGNFLRRQISSPGDFSLSNKQAFLKFEEKLDYKLLKDCATSKTRWKKAPPKLSLASETGRENLDTWSGHLMGTQGTCHHGVTRRTRTPREDTLQVCRMGTNTGSQDGMASVLNPNSTSATPNLYPSTSPRLFTHLGFRFMIIFCKLWKLLSIE